MNLDISVSILIRLLITEATQSKSSKVFARSNAGIVGSNLTEDMDVCVYSVFVLGSGFATS
jgi:hypothetical protein